jgi:hypothetical protein
MTELPPNEPSVGEKSQIVICWPKETCPGVPPDPSSSWGYFRPVISGGRAVEFAAIGKQVTVLA